MRAGGRQARGEAVKSASRRSRPCGQGLCVGRRGRPGACVGRRKRGQQCAELPLIRRLWQGVIGWIQ
eukprot:16231580-Heterocapsa_arctica.AAC.1